ncbi:MAG: hypothetical protein Ct9H300mP1_14280 [Planctomycetaceae bacterium]|nr:MAG: hypothetical protein Ct9H300mP1_14280 [Planctomycetaceae bacterium]
MNDVMAVLPRAISFVICGLAFAHFVVLSFCGGGPNEITGPVSIARGFIQGLAHKSRLAPVAIWLTRSMLPVRHPRRPRTRRLRGQRQKLKERINVLDERRDYSTRWPSRSGPTWPER